uniref:AMP-binding domain-containing protein n=1 Tax=Rhabditophanes sp. KR3021 TaxID=114890 RepID=A0AC35THC1_9BILA
MNRLFKTSNTKQCAKIVGSRLNSQYASGVITQTYEGQSIDETATNTSNDNDKSEKLVDFGISLLKGIWAVSDSIAYIPNKISGKAARRLSACAAIKAVPVTRDPAGPWRNLNVLDADLFAKPFADCDNLHDLWAKACAERPSKEIMGEREIKEIVNVAGHPSQVILGEYKWLTYKQINDEVNKITGGLKSLGLVKGDKVAIFAETRKEWMMTALACFKEGFPLVTIYATLGEEAVANAVKETGAKVLITSEDQLIKLKQIADNIPTIRKIVCFKEKFSKEVKELTKIEGKVVQRYEQFVKNGSVEKATQKNTVKEEDEAVVMYTSGTTGRAKGVILTHRNLIAGLCGMNGFAGLGGFLDRPDDIHISYLPSAHIFSLIVELKCLFSFVKTGYSSPLTLTATSPRIFPGSESDLSALKPTTLIVVPQVLNKLRSAVEDKLSASPDWVKRVLDTCYERKSSKYDEGRKTPFLDLLIFNKFKKVLGGRIRSITCGGAPLDPDTQRFAKMCFADRVDMGYGMTETCAVGTLCHPHDRGESNAGIPLDCLEIVLRPWPEGKYFPSNEHPQGEVLLHGSNVFKGYFNRDQGDDFVEINGKQYFCTGDIGEFTPNGNLRIIDRKKDLCKLNHGEYIALGKVESKLMSNVYIDNVCVIAKSDMDYCLALIVANKVNIVKLGKQLGIEGTFEELCEDEMINKFVLDDIKESMEGILDKYEVPRKTILLSKAWTAQDGYMTDAFKLKRKAIEEGFKKEIDEAYTPFQKFPHHYHN